MAATRAAGFTLLEVLVVVTLVAIIGSAVALSMGSSGDRRLESSAGQVLEAVNHAREAAVTSGRAYGFFVTPDACEMVVFDGEQWRSAAAGSVGATTRLEAPYELRGEGVYTLSNRVAPAPQMLLLPDGQQHYAGMAVINRVSGASYVITLAEAGRYELVPGAPP